MFRPSTHDAPYQIYTAQVVNTGKNIDVNGEAPIAWTVYSHAGVVQPSDLTGDYIGNIVADATADANTLVGGSEQGFELQQINAEGRGGIKTVPGTRAVSVHYGPPATAAEFKYYESAFRELYASAPASAAWIGRDGHVYQRCTAADPRRCKIARDQIVSENVKRSTSSYRHSPRHSSRVCYTRRVDFLDERERRMWTLVTQCDTERRGVI